MGLDIVIYEICNWKGLKLKVILTTLGQEQRWGKDGNSSKLFGVGSGGNPKSYDEKGFGGLEDAVDTWLELYNSF